MPFYQRVLGMPWVYERLRVFLLGGGPDAELFGWLGYTRHDILIDIGCGTGMAMEHLGPFRAYHGFDVDAKALERFRERRPPAKVHLYHREPTPADIDRIRPSKALLIGLLHHLSDEDALGILIRLQRGGGLRQVITLDPVRVPFNPLNSLFCRMDRGRYTRTEAGYRALFSAARFDVRNARIHASGNRAARYFCADAVPKS